ncbi:hypothetical protein L9F63_017253 [Diploptera punctata]|uniref:DUF4817 domain-containing protein n=1 Tax=Diploptera punctata TaxID=6984 RepID=A0AAD8EGY3_DIPPU|nr:hypothetical protein L9F63_017253 [Diploptera punctata]
MLDNNDIKQNGDSSGTSTNCFWYAERMSIITVQRNYRREYGGNASDGKTIKAWLEKCWGLETFKKNQEVLIHVFQKKRLKKLEQGFREAHENQFAKLPGISMDMLDRMWHEIEYRLDIVRATNGAHIEVF